MTTLKAAIISHILRAPAAQASATIQAAPVASSISYWTGPTDSAGTPINRPDNTSPNGWGEYVPTTLKHGRAIVERGDKDKRVKFLYAATIQEPVMVAEPGLRHSAAARKHAERIDNMHKGVVDVFAAIKAKHLAAPMVADPAGVALTYFECRECTECGHKGINDTSHDIAACNNCEWHGASPVEDICPTCKKTGVMSAACPKCNAHYHLIAEARLPAATAKAVPSEALTDDRILEIASEQDYGDEDPKCIIRLARALFAAPLADKTGGAE